MKLKYDAATPDPDRRFNHAPDVEGRRQAAVGLTLDWK
jgi:hypothetical protein